MAVNRLIYVFQAGTKESRIGNAEVSCVLEPDAWLFVPAFQTVTHHQEEGLRLISVHFNVELFSHLEFFAEKGQLLCGHAAELRHLFERFLETRKSLVANAFLLQGVLACFLAERILPSMKEPERLLKRYKGFSSILEEMGRNPYRNLSIDQMAAIMKMGRESFVKHFTAETGESPKSFFNKMRVGVIARELADPSLSLGEVADRFGFSSIYYFSRFFKRHLGISPRAYRKQSEISL